MSIGSRIRQLRLAHKLSGEAFGALCDVTKGRVSQWESGHGLPSIETLIKLREQLPFSFDWLLQGEDTSVAYTTTDPRIVQLLQALEPAAPYVKEAAVEAVQRTIDLVEHVHSEDKADPPPPVITVRERKLQKKRTGALSFNKEKKNAS